MLHIDVTGFPYPHSGSRLGNVAIVSIVVPVFGLSNFILRILKGNPKKELYTMETIGRAFRLRAPRPHAYTCMGEN